MIYKKSWSQMEKSWSQILNNFQISIPIPCKHYSGGIDLWIFVRLSATFCTELLSEA